MQAKGPDGDFEQPENVKIEILAILIATTDTTATFICAFVKHAIDNFSVMSKLIAEIRASQTQGLLLSLLISFDKTEKISYFMACIRETLRISPSTPVTFPRIVSEGGLVLNSTFVPSKIEIGANPFVINRDESVFGTDADFFRPER